MPQRYPFEPPKVQFVTPIYHPNIDSAGRICLDTLNLPPKGAWKPSLNISTVLSSLQLLMSEPNPDDGLMVDITHQYIHDHARFEHTAIEQTRRHAIGSDAAPLSSTDEGAEVAPTSAPAVGISPVDQAEPPGAPSAGPPTGVLDGAGSARTHGDFDDVDGDAEAKRQRRD